MNRTSCVMNIKSKMKTLTGSEKKVANYILNNYMYILDYTVTELAEKAGISDATVVRFCRSVGYKGYQDLKISLAQDMMSPYKQLNSSIEEKDTPEQIVDKVIRSEIETIEETLHLLDITMLEQVASIIKNARKIVFFGAGESAMVAHDAMHKFLKIRIRCSVEEDADIQAMESVLMKEGEVAIGISHSGTNKNVIECLKNAKISGATTVGLTTYGKSPMHRFCDYVIMTSTKETVFRSESVTARIAQLAVIDALEAVISFMDYKGTYEAIQITRKATSRNKY